MRALSNEEVMFRRERGPLPVLTEAGIVTEDRAEEIRQSGEVGVWRVLLALKSGADEVAVAEALAAAFGAPRLELIRAWPDAAEFVDERMVKLRYCAPLRELPDGRLALAMLDPSDRPSIDDIRIVTRREVEPMTVTLSELEQLWRELYPPADGFRDIISKHYLRMTVSDDGDTQRLLNLLLLQTNFDQEALVVDWSEEEVDITGLCASSTRVTDLLLARKITRQLRSMTDSPPPASLGGLTLHTSRSAEPLHFLIHFDATATAVEPVQQAVFESYF